PHVPTRRSSDLDADASPWYVARKDAARNALIVVQGHDHPLMLSTGLDTEPVHWLLPPPSERFRCAVKTRYRQPDQACTVEMRDSRAVVTFDTPQRAVTPGQYAVFYDGDTCLGGAVIASTRSEHL